MWTINNQQAYWVNFGDIILRIDEISSIIKYKTFVLYITFKNGKNNELSFKTKEERDNAFNSLWEMITKK